MIDALVKASSQRLRPILMTTGAMVLGTLLTIFVVPTMYSLFARQAIPGANQAIAREQPEAHPVPPEYVAK